MLRRMLFILTILGAIQLSVLDEGRPRVLRARAFMFAKGNPRNVIGLIDLKQWRNLVEIRGFVKGLKPGLHGFHIHEKGLLGKECADAGGHYNPFNMTHGAPYDCIRHVGDLGNIFIP
ncbi:hypothetical protein KIN20_014238, partial [Parelaphostrongylus tenuis]